MLIGSYIGNLGDKHRTAIPKRFLEEIGTQVVLAKWYEGCLILVETKFWNEILARLT
jgi:DNA-binding transcriptional regulator/RsmH inhibitor MraZ